MKPLSAFAITYMQRKLALNFNLSKSGAGYTLTINDHLYEGRSHRKSMANDPRMCTQKTREECEEKLAELIKTMKAEIAEMKKADNA